jgi:CRISPR-associated protein Csd2
MAKKGTPKSIVSAAAVSIATTEPTFQTLRERAIQHRYEMVYLIDCKDGNPNGDPDNGNVPRTDDVTGQGLMTGMSIKQKIRAYIELQVRAGILPEDGYDIYVKDGGTLNDEHRQGYRAIGLTLTDEDKAPKGPQDEEPYKDRVARWMCQHYFDTRTFGGMMETSVPVASRRGPVQVAHARSFHPITPWDMTIIRRAVTTREEKARMDHTMGRIDFQPYALFAVHIYVSAMLAEKTGFSPCDMAVLIGALREMPEHDHSAARHMNCRGLYVFKHESKLGNARAASLLSRVTARLKNEEVPPRCFEDYEVLVDRENLPAGIELIEYD